MDITRELAQNAPLSRLISLKHLTLYRGTSSSTALLVYSFLMFCLRGQEPTFAQLALWWDTMEVCKVTSKERED